MNSTNSNSIFSLSINRFFKTEMPRLIAEMDLEQTQTEDPIITAQVNSREVPVVQEVTTPNNPRPLSNSTKLPEKDFVNLILGSSLYPNNLSYYRMTRRMARHFFSKLGRDELLPPSEEGLPLIIRVQNMDNTTAAFNYARIHKTVFRPTNQTDILLREEKFNFWSQRLQPSILSLKYNTIKLFGLTDYIIDTPLESMIIKSPPRHSFYYTIHLINQIRHLRQLMINVLPANQTSDERTKSTNILNKGIFDISIIYPSIQFSNAFRSLVEIITYIRLHPQPQQIEVLKDIMYKDLCINNKLASNIIRVEDEDLHWELGLEQFSLSPDFIDFFSSYQFLPKLAANLTLDALYLLMDQPNFTHETVSEVIKQFEKIEDTHPRNLAQVGIDELLMMFNTSRSSTINSEHIFNHTIIVDRYKPLNIKPVNRTFSQIAAFFKYSEKIHNSSRSHVPRREFPIFKSHNTSKVNTSHASGIAQRLQQQAEQSNSLEKNNHTNLGTNSSMHEEWQVEGSKLQQNITMAPNNAISNISVSTNTKNIIATGSTVFGLGALISFGIAKWLQHKHLHQNNPVKAAPIMKVSIDRPPHENVEITPFINLEKGTTR